MLTHLEYGTQKLNITVPSSQVNVIQPTFLDGLPNETMYFQDAVRNPIGSKALKDLIQPTDKVAIVIPDITRPLPSDRLLPMLFEELSHVPAHQFTILNGTGSHRPNTKEELEKMVGKAIVETYRIVNHDAFNPNTLATVATLENGVPIQLNKEYVGADKRILLGFIEPHFMAGFSGGYKAVFPGIAGIESIMHYHRASVIAHQDSTWGIIENNPTQDQIRHYGSYVPVDFCINVAINNKHEITKFFCGSVLEAHAEGCQFVKSTAMVKCGHSVPIVITSNSGYPLDQNLYQAVKGMSAAAQILEPGGLIIMAARCNDGFPEHGNFRKLLNTYESPQTLLEAIESPGFQMSDQWQAQLFAKILNKARVALFSELPKEDVQQAYMNPIDQLDEFIQKALEGTPDLPVVVLPEGPMTIPYL